MTIDDSLAPDQPSSRRSRPSKRRRRQVRAAVWAITALAAAGGAVAGAEPAGLRPADIVLSALFAGAVAFAGSRSRRWTWVVASAVAGVVAPTLALQALAAAALVGAFAEIALDQRHRLAGAAITGVAVQVLLRLGDIRFSGATALLAAAATLPVLYSGYHHAGPREQRIVSRTMIVVGIFVVVFSAIFGFTALTARDQLETAVHKGREGLASLRNGDTDLAALQLDDSASSFEAAHRSLTSPLVAPARLLPIIGHNAKAATIAADAGTDVAAASSLIADNADYRNVKVGQGTIDLSLVGAMQQPAEQAADALDRAASSLETIDSPWLVPPLDDRVQEFRTEVDDTLPEAMQAAQGLAVAPELLGANGPRTYLVVFGTPAESRGLGGFLGSYAILTADGGHVELVEHGNAGDLDNVPQRADRTISGPDDYLRRYSRYFPTLFFKNLSASPDFPTVAQVIDEMYPQTTGVELDGVIYVDPYALGALLKLTGPVQVEGLQRPLNAKNAADFLLREQYITFPETDERRDFLGAASEAVFDALVSRDLPGPGTIGDVMGPMVREGRFLMSVSDPDAQAFLAGLGLSGDFPEPDGHDFVSVRTANAGASKIDVYLDRKLDYDVTFDPETGRVEGTATVTLTNNAPDGLPDYVAGNQALRRGKSDPPFGTALTWVELYTPHTVEAALVNDAEVPVQWNPELGWNVYSLQVAVQRGQSVTVTFPLTGAVDPTTGYRLWVDEQALANPDAVNVSVAGTKGWKVIEGPKPEAFTLDTDTTVRAELAPD